VRSLPIINHTHSGYGIGAVDEDSETPFQMQVPVPQYKANGEQWTFKTTLAYADLPGGALQNDLILTVVIDETERHGNQFDRQFTLGSKEFFDRRNNGEQVVW
jgi:serine protease AprX